MNRARAQAAQREKKVVLINILDGCGQLSSLLLSLLLQIINQLVMQVQFFNTSVKIPSALHQNQAHQCSNRVISAAFSSSINH